MRYQIGTRKFATYGELISSLEWQAIRKSRLDPFWIDPLVSKSWELRSNIIAKFGGDPSKGWGHEWVYCGDNEHPRIVARAQRIAAARHELTRYHEILDKLPSPESNLYWIIRKRCTIQGAIEIGEIADGYVGKPAFVHNPNC